MSDIKNFSDKVLDKFSKSITNKVFEMIQNDKSLMKEYLKLVSKHTLITVNQNIGKAIKKEYNLKNSSTRELKPSSILIQTHQEFK